MISKMLFALAVGASSAALSQSTDTAAGVGTGAAMSPDTPATQTGTAPATDVSVGTDATPGTGMAPTDVNTPSGAHSPAPMDAQTAPAYTGMGGPMLKTGADYPLCSGTVKDSCVQGGSRHKR